MKRLILVALVALTTQSALASQLSSSMSLGQTAIVAQPFACFDSFATLQQGSHAAAVGDRDGWLQLYANGHMTLVQTGWRVRYIANDIRLFGSTIPGIEFRLESGPYNGAGCWVVATARDIVRNIR